MSVIMIAGFHVVMCAFGLFALCSTRPDSGADPAPDDDAATHNPPCQGR